MRNNARLRVLALVLPLVVLPFSGAPADPVTQPEKDEGDAATQSQPEFPGPAQREEPAAGKQSPVDSFIPSETISADSAVSFPVDI